MHPPPRNCNQPSLNLETFPIATLFTRNDNRIFIPHDSPVMFGWYQSAVTPASVPFSACVNLNEPVDDYTCPFNFDGRCNPFRFNDNHLCFSMDGCDSSTTDVVISTTAADYTRCECKPGFFHQPTMRPDPNSTPYACSACSANALLDFVSKQYALDIVDYTTCFPTAATSNCEAQCEPGFEFSGSPSVLTKDITCSLQGGAMAISSTCQDKNECSLSALHECPSGTTCINDEPGYHCVCQAPTCNCYGATISQNDYCLPAQCQPGFCGSDRSRINAFRLVVDVEIFFIDIGPNSAFNGENLFSGYIKLVAHSTPEPGMPLPTISTTPKLFARDSSGGAGLSFPVDADFSSLLPDGIPSTDKVDIQLFLSFATASGESISNLLAAQVSLQGKSYYSRSCWYAYRRCMKILLFFLHVLTPPPFPSPQRETSWTCTRRARCQLSRPSSTTTTSDSS